jgi:allantoicase
MTTDRPQGLINLAEDALGARTLWSSDDFFAPVERMLQRPEPISRPGVYDDHGQWMDGWESRRRRGGGHDACIVQLAYTGIVRALDIDTRYFTGNYPPQASVEATNDADPLSPRTRWTTLVPQSPLVGNSHNPFPVSNDTAWRYLRLNIFPDGGVARLRVWGEISPDWNAIGAERVIDLFAMENGGAGLDANDQHYGQVGNLNRPGRGVNMGDGWETRRRREPGHDWAVVRLGHPGTIEEVEIDTAHFRGNYPDRVSLQAVLLKGVPDVQASKGSESWPLLLPEQKMSADAQHRFRAEVARLGAVSHVRMNLFPDGGVSRLRLLGRIVRP